MTPRCGSSSLSRVSKTTPTRTTLSVNGTVPGSTAPEARSVRNTLGPGRARKSVCESERSEEHTSELQSLAYLVCRLLLEKKKKRTIVLVQVVTQHSHSVMEHR